MSDNLIVIGLIFIFGNEIRCAGECDLVDVFLHLVCGHSQTVIDKGDGLLFRIYNHLHLRFIPFRQSVLSHHVQLL